MNMTHRARGCPFITNVDGEDFVIDGFAKYKGYGDECKTIYFAGVALFQDEENKENGKLVFPFCFEYSYESDEYKCYSKHFEGTHCQTKRRLKTGLQAENNTLNAPCRKYVETM